MKQLELYIHIPFCVKKCAYCDFLSGPSDEQSRKAYIEILCEEIKRCQTYVKNDEVCTIFFGGGTPSILEGEQIQQIMGTIQDTFHLADNVEVTLEMNPGTVTFEKLKGYQKAGVNRLSIGLQSVHEEELKLLGRIHTYEEFLDSYQLARKVGFENINIDLISAIPGQTVESWAETLQLVTKLQPEHISAYSLIIEPGTLFYEKYGAESPSFGGEQEPRLPSEEEERKMYWQTKAILKEAGYDRYEISNYAKPGYACRHNLGYWKRTPYLGFGVGAASFFEQARYSNPTTMEMYAKALEEKFRAPKLEREEEMEEFMFLGLRMMEGVSKQTFLSYFGQDLNQVYGEPIRKLSDLGLLQVSGDRISLTERGIDVSNAVFVEFMF